MTAKEALNLIETGATDRVTRLQERAEALRQQINAQIADEGRVTTSTVVQLVVHDTFGRKALDMVLKSMHTDGYTVYESAMEPITFLDISWGRIH